MVNLPHVAHFQEEYNLLKQLKQDGSEPSTNKMDGLVQQMTNLRTNPADYTFRQTPRYDFPWDLSTQKISRTHVNINS